MSIEYDNEQQVYYFNCPNCHLLTSVHKDNIACGIFRHGTMRRDGKQIDAHLDKMECDRLAKEGLIYGCGKPFRFNGEKVEKCSYI